MSEWLEYKLGDLTDWYSGGTPSKQKEEFWNGEIPWISASSMQGSRYHDSDLKITEKGLKSGSRLTSEDSILLLVRGSMLHQRVPVGICLRPVAFNQDVKAIKVKEEILEQDIIDPWFLLYWFIAKEKDLLDIVENTGIGAGKFDTKQLQDQIVRIPPEKTKKAFTATAKSLDDKIENNRRMNETLEAMAQAIFKSWFVDFDPVRAKVEVLESGGRDDDARLAAMQAISGKSPEDLTRLKTENPESYTELATTADAFPSAFTESPLGPIPEGWEVTDFGAVAECYDRLRIPLSKRQREQRPGNIPYYGATSVMDYVDEPIFDGIYLLLGEDGSVLKENGTPFTQYIWRKAWINNHAHVLQGKNGISTEHLLVFISQTNISAYVTGAVQLKLNQKNMNSIPFLKASPGVNDAFDKRIQAFYEAYRNNSEEIQTLAEARDALLPKLLSGEIDVSALNDTEEA